ncbi:unnamed protein product [Calypogeia fissa]
MVTLLIPLRPALPKASDLEEGGGDSHITLRLDWRSSSSHFSGLLAMEDSSDGKEGGSVRAWQRSEG